MSGAGACADTGARQPEPLDLRPDEGRFSFSSKRMTHTVLTTDLHTPLGAYLHLRDVGHASFLLESVDQGRLGRYSFVGCGDRLVSLSEAEELDEPVVGYLGYDHI